MKKILLGISILLLSAANVFAQSSKAPFKGFRQADTRHFRFIFEEESREAAQVYALYADEAWNKIAEAYSMPQEKIDVFVTARTNTVNAFTFFLPPEIMMFTSPVLTPDFGFREEWQKLFFTHELVHGANVTFEGKNVFGEKFFGPAVRAANYVTVPDWAMEGLATVMETELSVGGRGRSPYFELMFKAPTIDNGFIAYDEIDDYDEPPSGPAYVMGYMILRSVADRWGVEALADIERNRTLLTTWDDSVKMVTGEQPSDIYMESRAALSKKYNKERLIPEGKIISPRKAWTNFYMPSVILDDGSMVLLSSSEDYGQAAVIFDPSKIDGTNYFSSYYEDWEPESKTTVLFQADMPDSTSLAADKNLNIYTTQAYHRADSKPGPTTEYYLCKWTPQTGTRILNKDASLFQPSVSREGNLLVAIKQEGLKMVLVQVNTEDGSLSEFYTDEKFSVVEPSVNADGTKVAFLRLTGSRAEVCVYDVASKKLSVVFNGDGKIYDPAYPKFNQDGSLVFTSNNRGRLEVYEIANVDAAKPNAQPVVSDPVGALWACKTEKGILYSAYSSTGYVLKMKPSKEWGKVPDFNGPSMPGEVITFGDLETDYSDFYPYGTEIENYSKRIDSYKPSFYEEKSESKETSESEEDDEDELFYYIPYSAEMFEVITELQNEKAYVQEVQPVLYFPFVAICPGVEKNVRWGFGYNFIAKTSMTQQTSGTILASINYFPGINNIAIDALATIPFYNSQLDLLAHRGFYTEKDEVTGTKTFVENNLLLAAFTIPFITYSFRQDSVDIKWTSSADIRAVRSNDVEMRLFKKYDPYTFKADIQTGIESTYAGGDNNFLHMNTNTLFVKGQWSSDYSKMYFGVEGTYHNVFWPEGWPKMFVDASFRYMDSERASDKPTFSSVNFAGQHIDFLYPGRLVAAAGINLGSLQVSEEIMINFGKSKYHSLTPENYMPMNLNFNRELITNISYVLLENRSGQYLDCGVALSYDFMTKEFGYRNVYFNVHLDWIRF